MLEIEKNVPLPARGGYSKYPYSEMAIGDSFFVSLSPDQRNGKVGLQNNLVTSVRIYRAETGNGWSATTRQEEDGVRVWRTA